MKKCSCGDPLPPLAVEHDDPYCSARCARDAHGVVLTMPETNRGPKSPRRKPV